MMMKHRYKNIINITIIKYFNKKFKWLKCEKIFFIKLIKNFINLIYNLYNYIIKMNINELNTNNMLKTSFKILKEMLNDRKINTDYLDKLTEEEIIKLYEEYQIFDFKVNDTLKVIYYMNNKIKINDIRKYINQKEDANKKIIFISKEKLTTNNYKSFSDFKEVGISFSFFHIRELLINIYRHRLVPEHIPITDKDEISKIMKDYSLKTKYQFPLILNTDPICKYLDIKSDTLVKIIRPSKTSGEYILYRYCI